MFIILCTPCKMSVIVNLMKFKISILVAQCMKKTGRYSTRRPKVVVDRTLGLGHRSSPCCPLMLTTKRPWAAGPTTHRAGKRGLATTSITSIRQQEVTVCLRTIRRSRKCADVIIRSGVTAEQRGHVASKQVATKVSSSISYFLSRLRLPMLLLLRSEAMIFSL